MPKCMRCDLKRELRDTDFKREYDEYALRLRIAVAIAERRERLGLTQAQVAKEAGISQQLFSRVENCENYTIDTLFKITRALSLDLFRKTPSVLKKEDPFVEEHAACRPAR